MNRKQNGAGTPALAFILVVLTVSGLRAQTCCSGGVPLSNNLGLPNEGSGSAILSLSYDYNNLNTLLAGSDRLDDSSRQRETNSLLLNLGYSFTDAWSAEALFTWVRQTRIIDQFGNTNFTETTGIGDAAFLLKYTGINWLGARSAISIGAGAKAPLGASDIRSEEGLLFNADLQPGSGAWDLLTWASASKSLDLRPSTTLSLSMALRLTGENPKYLDGNTSYEFGDEWQVSLGIADQLLLFGSAIANPALVIRYRQAYRDRIDGQQLPNTGGRWVFIRPQLGINLSPHLLLSGRLELPLYSYVDGTQLTPTSRLTFGITYQIAPRAQTLQNIQL